jgi:hypothetical protein
LTAALVMYDVLLALTRFRRTEPTIVQKLTRLRA